MIKEDQLVNKCDCDGGCDIVSGRKVQVDYLYLDLDTCDRCIGTDQVLDAVMTKLTPALQIAGYEVQYNKIEMETDEIAKQYRFLSSPTIRVNGQDICSTVKENSCGCCSEISHSDVDCRVFEYDGSTYEVPPKEMISNEILSKVFGSCCSDNPIVIDYELPKNLRVFYKGKNDEGCLNNDKCC